MASGRKKDPIWIFYDELPVRLGIKGIRAKCKTCEKEIQGIVSRLKKHREEHEVNLFLLKNGDKTNR